MNQENRKPIKIGRLKRFVYLAERTDINLSHAANVKNIQRTGVVYREIIEMLRIFQMAMVWCQDNHSKI